MKEDLISIIIPIYNVGAYLDECLSSVASQSYVFIEVILVDDGSTDNSTQIALSYSEKDSRFYYFHKENGGLSDARNFGISKATGKYLTFIDSDDVISPDYISCLYNNLIAYNAEISIVGYCLIDEQSKLRSIHIHRKPRLYSRDKALVTMYSRFHNVDFVTAWGKLYTRELFNNIQYPKGQIHEDEFTTYKLFMKCRRIVYQGTSLYKYRVRNNSITTKKFGEERLAIFEAYKERLEVYKDLNENLYFLTRFFYIKKAFVYRVQDLKNGSNIMESMFNSELMQYYTPLDYLFHKVGLFRVFSLVLAKRDVDKLRGL